MLSEYRSINLLGVQVKKLEKQKKYSLPYYLAFPLVLNNKAKWVNHKETNSSLLNKLVNLFRIEQRTNTIQRLNSNSIGILYILIKELISTGNDKELDIKIDQEMRNFTSQRIKKILTKYKITGPKEIKKQLDPLEDIFFNEIHLIIQIYEQFLHAAFKTPENLSQ
ncbi:MAG: hypothetical protein HeimC3_23630 [Candidatus Heimdallarchaeota archaeon LC_3]|nr:MAG: hypothetical protein HeimC3_23630 [Candidatus Heimdallarchaeota archaeon LC_3]